MAYLLIDMLVHVAKGAKIRVPRNPEKYDPEKYPHWHVFQHLQFGTSLPYPEAGHHNAQLIASLPSERLRRINFRDLERLGFQHGRSHG
jgi:hypothetical protein